MSATEVLQFWFEELTAKQRFAKDGTLDETIRQRFGALHSRAARGELQPWRKDPAGRLAEIIVLDQFSRNLYREDARAFACDPLALKLAAEAVMVGADLVLPIPRRAFLYMPFMHSESLSDHEQAVRLFSQPGLEDNLKFELRHQAIIEKFGRFPHRNLILGRPSTPDEVAFLQTPGSSF